MNFEVNAYFKSKLLNSTHILAECLISSQISRKNNNFISLVLLFLRLCTWIINHLSLNIEIYH